MSVTINSNHAATLASNNLAESSRLLQRSLNRLSSGSRIVEPSDDAGGLAVSMKLSAAAHRQSAAMTNLGNSTSYLQTQDGAMKVAGRVLERISELKALSSDPTKSSSDIDNYDVEFQALQLELQAISGETFNGINLFGSAAFEVSTNEDGGQEIEIGGMDLMGGTGTSVFSDSFSNLSNWGTVQNSSASGGAVVLADVGRVQRTQSISGAFDVTFDVKFSAASNIEVGFLVNGFSFSSLIAGGSEINDTATHSVRIAFDGAGNADTFLDGSTVAADSASGLATSITDFSLQNTYSSGNTASVSNFAITTGDGTPTNVSTVANASDIRSLDLGTITSAIQDLATLRADNGAQQSRLGFATELLTVNKANLEAASSRITDVDVAQESTALARYNVLVQAGTSMLSQANQASQTALRLLT